MPPFEYAMHRMFWDWLSKHPYSAKWEWPGWDMLGARAKEDCFACGYVAVIRPSLPLEMRGCPSCPLDWGRHGSCSYLYQIWLHARSVDERIYAAEKIRDIPLKPWIEELDLSICRSCGKKKAEGDYFNALCRECDSNALEVCMMGDRLMRKRVVDNGDN